MLGTYYYTLADTLYLMGLRVSAEHLASQRRDVRWCPFTGHYMLISTRRLAAWHGVRVTTNSEPYVLFTQEHMAILNFLANDQDQAGGHGCARHMIIVMVVSLSEYLLYRHLRPNPLAR